MPATTQLLLEKINEVEELIRTAGESGQDTAVLKHQLKDLFEQLKSANGVLSEGKGILKG